MDMWWTSSVTIYIEQFIINCPIVITAALFENNLMVTKTPVAANNYIKMLLSQDGSDTVRVRNNLFIGHYISSPLF